MKINLKHFFPQYDCLLATKDFYLGCSIHGITKLNKTDFSVVQEALDAFRGQFFFLSYDNRYLIAENIKLGIRVYDTETLEMVSEYLPMMKGKSYAYGFELSPDQKSFYLIMGEPMDASVPPMFPDELVQNSDFIIRRLSFPELKQMEDIPMEEKIVDIAYLPFMKSYLACDYRGQYYFYDGQKKLTKTSLSSKAQEAIGFSDAEKIVTVSDFGIRLFDRNLNEQGMIDLVPDEQEEVSSALYGFLTQSDDFTNGMDNVTKVNKERIVSVRPLGDDMLVSFTAESVNSYTKVTIYGLRQGDVLCSYLFGENVTSVNVLDETHLGACVAGGVYLLEVTA